MNTEYIIQEALEAHRLLGKQTDAADRDLFDKDHRAIWAKCEMSLLSRLLELKTKTGLSAEEALELGKLSARLRKA